MSKQTRATYLCIGCPLGCHLEVCQQDASDPLKVEGHACRRGWDYALKEHTAPERMVASSVKITGSSWSRLPVKTLTAVPKDQIQRVCHALRDVVVQAPVRVGQVIVADVAGLSVDVVATRTLLSVLDECNS